MRILRILICGDRNWSDKEHIRECLLIRMPRVACVIEGEARGADELAGEVADELGIPVERYPAEWSRYGRANAGPIRNQQMLDEGKPDIVWGFHDNINQSKGTKDMLNRAKGAGLRVFLISHAWDTPAKWQFTK